MKPEELSKVSDSLAMAPTAHAGDNKELTATVLGQAANEESLAIQQNGSDPAVSDSQISFLPRIPPDRYTLLEELGEGGFGSVWSAIQHQPVRREVAVKILKAGMNQREIVSRFALEKQALAVMDHPGIARVYDAGVTSDGSPFFVMELVRGQTLNQFCISEGLGLEERLKLFLQVCQAIQHAHRKGIIHRDLKPSNILVCRTDAGNQIKVIDFGIAKAVTPVADVSMQTQMGQFMGTPAYMSPEQAEGHIDDIDIRSDVYSLGVILYELLTGVRPFEYRSGKQLTIDEVRRRIREEVPPRPSRRVQQLETDNRATTSEPATAPIPVSRKHQLSSIDDALLNGDLDWITMKAIEKDRSRRYESANDLALDIQRYLSNEPVLACPPSRWYQTSKFIARHRWAVSMVSLMVMTLLISSIVSTVLYLNEQVARTQADQESFRARQMVKILSDMIAAAGPSVSQGKDPALMKDILAATSKRIDEELVDQPEIELEVRQLLYKAYEDIGEFPLALQLQFRVVELINQLHPDDPVNLAAAYAELSQALDALDRLEEAEKYLMRSIQLREQVKPAPIAEIAADRELLAWLMARRGDFTSAEREARQALVEFPEDHKDAPGFRAQTLMTLGLALLKTAQFEESVAVHREALAIFRKMHQKPHPATVTAINNLCHILVEVGEFDEIESLATEGLKMEETLSGESVGTCTDAFNKALSTVYIHRREYDRAISCLTFAIEAATKIYGADHRFTNDKRSLLAQAQLLAGRTTDAERTLQDAATLGGTGESADNSLELAAGKLALAKGELDRAAEIAQEEYRRKKAESLTPSIGQIEATLLLADISIARNQTEHAQTLLHEALDILKPEQNPKSELLQAVLERTQKLSSAP